MFFSQKLINIFYFSYYKVIHLSNSLIHHTLTISRLRVTETLPGFISLFVIWEREETFRVKDDLRMKDYGIFFVFTAQKSGFIFFLSREEKKKSHR